MLSKLNENKWSIFALGAILGALLMTRGGLATLMPLARFVLPIVIVLVIFSMLKKKLMGSGAMTSIKEKMEEAMRQAQQQQGQRPGGGGKVIDLCPKCGTYLAAGHRCKTKG